jgi:putative endonuclease
MIYVYIIESLKDKSQYVGMSENTIERLKYHNQGRVKSTKSKIPWTIIHTENFNTRKEARKREKYLKAAAGRRFRKKYH